MEKLKFKTNINCGNCVSKVSPFLNQVEEIENWKVDTSIPEKILTVEGEDLSSERIKEVVESAGFEITVIA
ncbi:heavy-metal-associated domain-containing protein [Flectobacillus sp. DC10W]|uniref:Heavy-metal-associated domain-containing protein n=1 Tax=Flectobacillus longus TaxID=2984207 RepID=A0ABT6YGQ1_9BACT|nr:heavy-metal-associated domain-containing protein [Flectobacillus longus]MDI9862769.1 heavy-metal-associated domain-containing protein [Flectobacillus longus]